VESIWTLDNFSGQHGLHLGTQGNINSPSQTLHGVQPLLLYNIIKKAQHQGIEHMTSGAEANYHTSMLNHLYHSSLKHVVFYVIHTNHVNTFLERTLANPDARFGVITRTSMVMTGNKPCENHGLYQIWYGMVWSPQFPDQPRLF
jgi:hypothetical protein